MAKMTRAEYLALSSELAPLATIASGKNPDGTDFTLGTTGGGSDATAAKQDTGNTSLASIDGKTPALGQALAASSQPVVLTAIQLAALLAPVLAAGEAHVGAVGGHTALVTATLTRPADTNVYASGDLVANHTTAGSVVPLSFTVARVAAGSGMIRRLRLRTSSTSITLASFRLHLYSVSPVVTNGDNGVWLSDQAATYLGALDVTLDRAFSDGAAGNGLPVTGSDINFALASGQVIYGLAEARAAYVPTSAEVLTFSLEILQN